MSDTIGTSKKKISTTMSGQDSSKGSTKATTGSTTTTKKSATATTTSTPSIVKSSNGGSTSVGMTKKSSSSSSSSKVTTTTGTAATTTTNDSKFLMDYVWLSIMGYCIYRILYTAYKIRLLALEEYGLVIHEFDPYFNFRATEYLYWNGMERFFKWFDYKVWYPLGRPVGTTIYPGMQFTAVYIKQFILPTMSLNDICCYIPAWFGVLTTAATGLIAYECTIPTNTTSTVFHYLYNLFIVLTTGKRIVDNDDNTTTTSSNQQKITFLGLYSPAMECGVVAAAMMSIVPAHLMRSIGGGYDNESVAVPAMVWTCYFWVRSLRANDPYSWLYGIITGLSYFYMVASWGGYVFLINLLGVHAAALVLIGRFDTKTVYRSYTLFYLIGTTLAMQVPVVGYTPIKSLEQLGPCAVFIGYQLLYVTETVIASKFATIWTRKQKYLFRIQIIGVATTIAFVAAIVLAPTGYFGPFSARVRGLFVKHTKTGNPLVDSVAEHQPASSMAYFQYLHHVCTVAPLGFTIVLCRFSNASSFLIIWGIAAYFFSHKMVRLILLTAPIGCVLGGIFAGRMLVWCIQQWWDSDSNDNNNNNTNPSNNNLRRGTLIATTAPVTSKGDNPITETQSSSSADGAADVADATTTTTTGIGKSKGTKATAGTKKVKKAGSSSTSTRSSSKVNHSELSSFDDLIVLKESIKEFGRTKEGIMTRRGVSIFLLVLSFFSTRAFINFCWRLQHDLSNPSIIMKARRNDGVIVTLDDYREAYWWLRDNTPEDSRIMAWWDYGYQISSIANRTTLADGNTWNHEHIALLGKALTTNLEEGWEIARHLADYVLIWAGGGGDDLAKSPHLARIATSVYRDHCPDDPTCRAFGFVNRQQTPSSMMKRSLLYRLHQNKIRSEVVVPEDMFVDVYRSTYGKVRIYKVQGISEESKQWVADPANRICDAPGSWFCPGQYPPGLAKILSQKNDFRQLEDFNRRVDGDSEYQERYFRDLQDPEGARRKILEKEQSERLKEQQRGMTEEEKHRQLQKRDEIYNSWADTDDTTHMWRLISTNDIQGLKEWLDVDPNNAFIRSKDGRGPMWWAFEKRNDEITKILMKAGVPHTDVDAKGLSPLDLLERSD